MIIGLSKEYLINSLQTIKTANIDEYSKAAFSILLEKLITQCYDLDPWIPIDDKAKDGREILLKIPYNEYEDDTSYTTVIGFWDIDTWCSEGTGKVNPSHYKEIT